MRITPLIRTAVAALSMTTAVFAGEYAVLDTGFRIRAEGHELVEDRVRLFVEGGGTIEFPAAQIATFEQEEYVPPAAPIPAPPGDTSQKQFDLHATVKEIADEHDLPEALVHSVIATESAYNPDAVSIKGAIGLMQLMPETARELAVDPKDPGENVQGGVSYLKQLLEKYKGAEDQLVKALAAYNAGPGAVDRYDGIPPYAETRQFVTRVIERFLTYAEKGAPK